eukprot:3817272-Ditylum_brightwellii.AAC.1
MSGSTQSGYACSRIGHRPKGESRPTGNGIQPPPHDHGPKANSGQWVLITFDRARGILHQHC